MTVPAPTKSSLTTWGHALLTLATIVVAIVGSFMTFGQTQQHEIDRLDQATSDISSQAEEDSQQQAIDRQFNRRLAVRADVLASKLSDLQSRIAVLEAEVRAIDGKVVGR